MNEVAQVIEELTKRTKDGRLVLDSKHCSIGAWYASDYRVDIDGEELRLTTTDESDAIELWYGKTLLAEVLGSDTSEATAPLRELRNACTKQWVAQLERARNTTVDRLMGVLGVGVD